MATGQPVGKMNATGLIRTLCRIVDAIRQFLQRPTTADGGTLPNGKEQALSNEVPKTAVLSETAAPPAVEVPSEVASGQETAIKPEVVHPVAEPVSTPESTITPEPDTAAVTDSAEDSTEGSTEDSAEDPEDESEHPSPPPPQASPEKNNEPPKQPQARSGRRGKSRPAKSSSQERAAPETRPPRWVPRPPGTSFLLLLFVIPASPIRHSRFSYSSFPPPIRHSRAGGNPVKPNLYINPSNVGSYLQSTSASMPASIS